MQRDNNSVRLLHDKALLSPDRLAVVFGHRSIDFHQLSYRIKQNVSYLQSIGVREGDPILVVLPASIELTVLLFACMQMGALCVLADPNLGQQKLNQLALSIQPRCYVSNTLGLLRGSRLEGLRRIPVRINVGKKRCSPYGLREAKAMWPSDQVVRVSHDHPAFRVVALDSDGRLSDNVMTHGAIVDGVVEMKDRMPQRDGVVMAYDLGFSVIQLCCGSSVINVASGSDLSRSQGKKWVKQMNAYRVTHCQVSKKKVNALLVGGCLSLRYWVIDDGPICDQLIQTWRSSFPNAVPVEPFSWKDGCSGADAVDIISVM